jgi:hypothetical protein
MRNVEMTFQCGVVQQGRSVRQQLIHISNLLKKDLDGFSVPSNCRIVQQLDHLGRLLLGSTGLQQRTYGSRMFKSQCLVEGPLTGIVHSLRVCTAPQQEPYRFRMPLHRSRV